jgi:large subunit ribosomal protein L3
MLGLVGKKVGMTQIFENGKLIPVTVISAGPNYVLQKKEIAKEGYTALQVGFDETREKVVSKPLLGIFKKAGVAPQKYIGEFTVDSVEGFELGQEIKVDLFNETKFVDVTGVSKGKGFQGVMKRHGFGGNRATHGVSRAHRNPGSIGQSTTPSKVLKGMRMPGRMGTDTVTVQSLRVIKVDVENNLLVVKGAIPGAKNGYLTIKPAVKK